MAAGTARGSGTRVCVSLRQPFSGLNADLAWWEIGFGELRLASWKLLWQVRIEKEVTQVVERSSIAKRTWEGARQGEGGEYRILRDSSKYVDVLLVLVNGCWRFVSSI